MFRACRLYWEITSRGRSGVSALLYGRLSLGSHWVMVVLFVSSEAGITDVRLHSGGGLNGFSPSWRCRNLNVLPGDATS